MQLLIEAVLAFGILGIVGILIYAPAMYSRGVLKLVNDDITKSESIQCWIPFLNMMKAQKLYKGKVFNTGLVSLLLAISIGSLLGILYIPNVSPILFKAVLAVTVIIAVVWIIMSVADVWTILRDTQVTPTGQCIFYSIFFPVGQVYIGYFLTNMVKNYIKEESTFEG